MANLCHLEDFLLLSHMIINDKILAEIKNYSVANLHKEVCGFVVLEKDDLLFIKTENRHPDEKNFFLISPKDYLNIKNNYKILYFFHSHIDNAFFSELDILQQKYHNINMLLYDLKSEEFKEMKCK